MSIIAGIQILTHDSEASSAADPPVETTTDPANYVENETVSFFYVSDLLDIILKSIEENMEAMKAAIDEIDVESAGAAVEDEEVKKKIQGIKADEIKKINKFQRLFKTFRVLLGPLEIVDPKNPAKTQFVTLGDIPIATRYFTEWLTMKMLKKGEPNYPLTIFLNDFISQLLRDFMNSDTCFNGAVKQKVRLFQSALTSYRNEMESGAEWDNITQAIINHGIPPRLNMMNANVETPILNISGDRGFPDGGEGGYEREINYITYFAGRTQPTELMKGDRAQDEARGLFHYAIGRDRGIVKTIGFEKTSVPSLKMVRFEQQGYDGLQQLREQYDGNIKTYANVNAFPGSYIYIEPLSFAPNAETDLTQLGIGGYNMIIRSEHTLAPGLAETTITTKWVAEIDKTAGAAIQTNKQAEEVEEQPDDTPNKCWIESDRAAEAVAE